MHKRRLVTEEKDILIENISDFLKAKEYILFAYIFGSFVSEAGFNDIDVGIYISAESLDNLLNLELKLESDLLDIVHLPVDVRVINHAPLTFNYNILKNRIVIVDNDKSLRADFEGKTYKEYFDFKHLRDEYLREIINAPV